MTTTLNAEGMQTVVARTPSQVQDMRSDWETLNVQHAPMACVQNDPVRYLTEARILAGQVLPHVALFRGENGPRGIIVGKEFEQRISCRIGYVRLPLVNLKCFGVSHGGIVTDGSREAQDAVLDYLSQMRRDNQVDYVMINHLPTSHELFSRIQKSGADLQTADMHWRWRLGKTAEQSLSHRSAKTRGTIRRHDKRLSAQFKTELLLRRWESESDINEFCSVAGQITAKGYQGAMNVGFADTSLWRAFILEEARHGRMRCYTLEGDGEAIAFQVGVVRRRIYMMEETAFDPQYRAHSPGLVLLVRIMADLCQSGVLAIDYGLGDAGYKQDFATERTEEVTLHFYGRRAKAQLAKNAVRVCDGLTGAVKGVIRRAGVYDWVKRKWRRRLEARAEA